MDLGNEMRVAELLASRLCHDVVGPIGAVNNGMELLHDGDLDMADDALKLAAQSAQQAADLLQYYRLAYGMAGHRQGGDLKPMHDLAVRLFTHHKASLDWSANAMPTGLPDSAGKLILNMLLLAGEALPRGGTVGVLFAALFVIDLHCDVADRARGFHQRRRSAVQLLIEVRAPRVIGKGEGVGHGRHLQPQLWPGSTA